MENKIAHLNMIQGVINRMAQNSFLLKGWSVTLISALFALTFQNKLQEFSLLTIIPCMMFWGLDGYFLRQERLYRELYKSVSLLSNDDVDFSMNANIHENNIDNWFFVSCSPTLLAFHGVIAILIILILVITKCNF